MSRFDRSDAPPSFALPRVGPGLKAVLAVIGVVGIVMSIVVGYSQSGPTYFQMLAYDRAAILHGQVWRLVTAGLLTSPDSMGHLIFTLIGLYFLSPELEKNWGTARFIRFLVTSVVVGYLFTLGLDIVSGSGGPRFFHPPFAFGAGAAITAVAIAWSQMHRDARVNLFFFLPMSGRALFWVTVGFAALGLVYPSSVPEGVFAPFGGIVVGMLLGGTPSVLRRLWLQTKLVVLRRQSAAAKVQPLVREQRPRRAAPPLRVVKGGIIEEDDEKKPPKDKRYLN